MPDSRRTALFGRADAVGDDIDLLLRMTGKAQTVPSFLGSHAMLHGCRGEVHQKDPGVSGTVDVGLTSLRA